MARASIMACVVAGVVLAMCLAGGVSGLNCLLFHGVGQDGPGPNLLAPGQIKTTNKNYLRPGVNMPDYWGDAGQRLAKAGCTNVYGYWTETALYAWSDAAIQQEYCAAIVGTNADVVFTHSMGGPIIAGALHNGRTGCADRIAQGANAKTHWYGLQSPLAGSEAADVLTDVCQNPIIAKFAGRCAQDPATGKWAISHAYASLQTANCPAYLKETAQKYESGNMCGVLTQNVVVAPDRIGSGLHVDVKLAAERVGMGAGLEFIRAAVVGAFTLKGKPVPADWAANNMPSKSATVPAHGTDGMVGFGSCRTQPVTAYQKDPKSHFYAVEANHGDGRGTFGDDPHDLGFQPIQYMINMVANTAQTKKPNGNPVITPRFAQTFNRLKGLYRMATATTASTASRTTTTTTTPAPVAQADEVEADAEDQDQDQDLVEAEVVAEDEAEADKTEADEAEAADF